MRTFDYTIENINGTNILTITSPEGDSAVFYDYILSTNDLEIEQAFIVYPNPVQNILIINSEIPLDKIEIYNLQGQLLFDTINNQIDVSFLSSGIYYVAVIINQENNIITLIKD